MPFNLNRLKLKQFISLKNEAMMFFCGNKNKNIEIDFPKGETLLRKATELFKKITDQADLPTEKILKYIVQHNSYPPQNFSKLGMNFNSKTGDNNYVKNISNLANSLLKSLDISLHHYLINNSEWENLFKFEWKEDGDLFFKYGDISDGAYLIDIGEVKIVDKNGDLITILKEGCVFGEMAFLEDEGHRNAIAVAKGAVRVQKISADDFQNNLPLPIKQSLYAIAQKRLDKKLK